MMLNRMQAYPSTPNPLEVMEEIKKGHENLFFSDVQVRGKYPSYAKRFFLENNINIKTEKGDEEILEMYPVNFMSFSYYMNTIARYIPKSDAEQTTGNFISGESNPYLETSDWGWKVDPVVV